MQAPPPGYEVVVLSRRCLLSVVCVLLAFLGAGCGDDDTERLTRDARERAN